MGKYVFSAADCFYDRLCADYILRSNPAAAFSKGALRVSSYSIEGLGYASLIRVQKSFGRLTEAAVFAPLYKDAPVFMADRVKTLFSDSLSVNILDAGLKKMYYRQFQNVSDDYNGMPDADCSSGWYQDILISGSVCKNIKGRADAAQMLEDYLGAYIKIMEFAEKCCSSEKGKKLCEIRDGFLEKGSESADFAKKVLSEAGAAELFEKILFPAE